MTGKQKYDAVNILKNLDLKNIQKSIEEIQLDEPSSIDVRDFAGKPCSKD